MRLSNFRSVAVSLALCAMVLRALLPDGWMPAPAASAAPFVICSMDGIHTGGKQPADPAHERAHAPCAFAAAAPLSPPLVAIMAVPVSQPVERLALTARSDPFTSHAIHRANAPRAPPAFS